MVNHLSKEIKSITHGKRTLLNCSVIKRNSHTESVESIHLSILTDEVEKAIYISKRHAVSNLGEITSDLM